MPVNLIMFYLGAGFVAGAFAAFALLEARR
jgi:hypothetical protein